MSQLFVIGLSHRTAPVEIREALAHGVDEAVLREHGGGATGEKAPKK